MQHFIIDQEISGKELRILDKALLHQMKDVLRFQRGDEIIVMDGQGTKAKGFIEELHKKGALIRLAGHEVCRAPERRVRLFCAISKKLATFEMIVQKATELGVTDIYPLVTNRTQVDQLRKVERIEAIVREACEQCERCFVPRLHEPTSLSAILEEKPRGTLLAGDARNYDKKIKDIKCDGDVNLIIGPEGGLTDEELAGIRAAGGTIFLLGETVLRMETAAIAALSVVQFGGIC
jgi:16S rRNA (uracil1498-N3)-methyltransferase